MHSNTILLVAVLKMKNQCVQGNCDSKFVRFYNIATSFRLENHRSDTKLTDCIWGFGEMYGRNPCVRWSIIRKVKPGRVGDNCCRLCQEKLAIVTYPNRDVLLNERAEILSKCKHLSKYLLVMYEPG